MSMRVQGILSRKSYKKRKVEGGSESRNAQRVLKNKRPNISELIWPSEIRVL